MTTTRGGLSTRQICLILLATFRATRVVTDDYITDDLRQKLRARLPEKPAYLIGCPWCASFWIAPVIVTVVYLFPRSRLVEAVLVSLSASAAAGLLTAIGPPPDDIGVTVHTDSDG